MRIVLSLVLSCIALSVHSQQRPLFQTTKVEGTENVYVFRYGGHQSMFIVTKDGVIATDPISYGRPEAAKTYIEEIKKVSDKPIKYLIYSHHHYDHIAGGQPFKDAGARIIAHKRAKERLEQVKDPFTPLPDETFEKSRTLKLGGTVLELHYMGLNHSDTNLVMRLPKEKIVFIVDTIPVGAFPGRGFIDIYPLETEQFMERVLKMDWERMIPGHPGQPADRLGTKKDVEDQLALIRHASDEVKKWARDGKCWEPAEKEVKLEKYESWPGYQAGLPLVVRRYCGLWGRGT
ncbi:MAG TPA: MBL fold metallo-hydrolase [Burkholderiales bacterium]|nr:MBL fold metallo-hydrolase [Burkholderiales bacterium]